MCSYNHQTAAKTETFDIYIMLQTRLIHLLHELGYSNMMRVSIISFSQSFLFSKLFLICLENYKTNATFTNTNKTQSSQAEVIYYPTDKQCHKLENYLIDAMIFDYRE